MSLTIADGLQVSLDLRLTLEGGEVFHRTEGQGAVVFIQGQGLIGEVRSTPQPFARYLCGNHSLCEGWRYWARREPEPFGVPACARMVSLPSRPLNLDCRRRVWEP